MASDIYFIFPVLWRLAKPRNQIPKPKDMDSSTSSPNSKTLRSQWGLFSFWLLSFTLKKFLN